ncbi:Kinesin-like protein [Trichinella spiralis]|uniref:Kinesin-like protein n=1 Tax=Trichinella spiralis TaxID=6334 RepID=A0ABR3KZX3_TRISP
MTMVSRFSVCTALQQWRQEDGKQLRYKAKISTVYLQFSKGQKNDDDDGCGGSIEKPSSYNFTCNQSKALHFISQQYAECKISFFTNLLPLKFSDQH